MSEWHTTPLVKVATLQRGFDLPTRLRRPGKVPIVSSSGVSGWHDRSMVAAPGVVTGRYGTIGEVYYEAVDFWPLNTTLWVSNFHGNDQRFVYYLLQRIDYATHSGKSGVPGVNRNDLHSELVRTPVSVTEQRSIATALAETDDLIQSLEKTIAKKRAVKEGMMQALFSNTSGWSRMSLGSVADVIDPHPSHRAPPAVLGGVPFVGIGDVNTHGRVVGSPRLVAPQILSEHSARYAFSSGLLGLGRVASIGKVVRFDLDSQMAVSPTMAVLRPKHVSRDFLCYVLQAPLITDQFVSLTSGSTRSSIGMESLRALSVPVPENEEGSKIGQMLADVDAEIIALERRRDSTRDIKLGMMQELLTGRTRMVVKQDAA